MSINLPPNEPKKDPNEDRFQKFFHTATNNVRDIIAYVLLILGIILLFFQHLYGGFLIGLVAGIYFSKEIIYLINNYEDFIENEGLVRSLILAGTLLAFLISAPAIFVGIAIAIALKILLVGTEK
jgi:uncharacterized membrane protein